MHENGCLIRVFLLLSKVQRGKLCGNYLSHNAETSVNFFLILLTLKNPYIPPNLNTKPQCNEIRSKSKPNFQPQVIYFTQIILTFGITGRLEYYKQRREQHLIGKEVIMRNFHKKIQDRMKCTSSAPRSLFPSLYKFPEEESFHHGPTMSKERKNSLY